MTDGLDRQDPADERAQLGGVETPAVVAALSLVSASSGTPASSRRWSESDVRMGRQPEKGSKRRLDSVRRSGMAEESEHLVERDRGERGEGYRVTGGGEGEAVAQQDGEPPVEPVRRQAQARVTGVSFFVID